MKKATLSLIILAGGFMTLTTSCVKKYKCKCTYIHHTVWNDSIPKADIVEESEVTARMHEIAIPLCKDNESKYMFNNYDGQCNVE